MSAVDWFNRGKEAHGRGEPRELVDGRISPANRQAWFDGYDENVRLLRLRSMPATERQASLDRFRLLKAALDTPPENNSGQPV